MVYTLELTELLINKIKDKHNKLIKYLHISLNASALLLIVNFIFPVYGAEVIYPNNDWEFRQPEDLGLPSDKVKKLIDLSFLDDSTQAVVIIKDGFLVAEKYAETYNLSLIHI